MAVSCTAMLLRGPDSTMTHLWKLGMSLSSLTAAIIVAGLGVLPLPAGAQSQDSTRPNIIIFIGDDLGWRDLGVYGNRFIQTPNIDRLARSGLRVQLAFGTS